MTITGVSHMFFHGLDAVAMRAADGAQAIVTLHGGHVVSWTPAGSDLERLYLSPASVFSRGQAIRGGVPVVFPQFANRGPLANHGFARTSAWQLQHHERGPGGEALAVLRLVDDARMRSVWPHEFVLELGVRVLADSLTLELSCTNTGAAPMPFTCALHTYLRVADVSRVVLEGLCGQAYWDKTDERDKTQDAELLVIDGEVDRVYAGVLRDLLLRERVGVPTGALHISQRGFDDVVVWNPGERRCALLPDMPAQGYRQMLCVEAARIAAPVLLQCGQRWQGLQQLRVSDEDARSPDARRNAPTLAGTTPPQ